jgi:hypothetical protein
VFDWGWEYKVVGMCDSSAALGVIGRKGVGKIRHLDVGAMSIQDLREKGGIDVIEVKGTSNPADQVTKYLGAGDVMKGVSMVGLEFREGRAEKGVKVQERIRKVTHIEARKHKPEMPEELGNTWMRAEAGEKDEGGGNIKGGGNIQGGDNIKGGGNMVKGGSQVKGRW